MSQGGIFKGPTALGTACAGCGEMPNTLQPEAWWMQEPKTTPWWHETPHLMKPLQERAWYLPEEQGPSTVEIIEAREADSTRAGLIVAGVLAGLVVLAGALGGRIY